MTTKEWRIALTKNWKVQSRSFSLSLSHRQEPWTSTLCWSFQGKSRAFLQLGDALGEAFKPDSAVMAGLEEGGGVFGGFASEDGWGEAVGAAGGAATGPVDLWVDDNVLGLFGSLIEDLEEEVDDEYDDDDEEDDDDEYEDDE